MTLSNLQSSLALALSTDALPVAASFPAGDPDELTAYFALVEVRPRERFDGVGKRDEGDGRFRRVAHVTARFRLHLIAPGSQTEDLASIVDALGALWWLSDAPDVASGRVVAAGPERGFAVEGLRLIQGQVDEVPANGAHRGHVDLDVDARLWPIDPLAPVGVPLRRIVLQVAGDPIAVKPAELRVAAGSTTELAIALDARRLELGTGALGALERRATLRFVVKDLKDTPRPGALDQQSVVFEGSPVRLRYSAGASATRERLEVWLEPSVSGGPASLLGSVAVEVTS